ncbi:MAG: thioredoxin domain-containing protein [Halomonadaceae bacterium]|nr:thioredoxin domain-containing protein [Halomonadaceae bacterium]
MPALRIITAFRRTLTAMVITAGLSAGAATANDQPIALVEFASFDCQFCQQMGQHHHSIEAAVESAGLDYRYVPLPSHTRLAEAWRERAYYASRAIPGIAQEARRVFLAAGATNVPLNELDAVLAHLELHLPQVRWNDFAEDHIDAQDSQEALERGVELARRAGLRSFPSFAVVSRSGVELLSLPADVDAKAQAVIDYLETL